MSIVIELFSREVKSGRVCNKPCNVINGAITHRSVDAIYYINAGACDTSEFGICHVVRHGNVNRRKIQ